MADTIFALATAPGRAGISVIRLSGPEAEAAVSRLSPAPLAPRRASLRTLRDSESGETIDQAVLLLYPAPGSFTGETVVEIQCHGSRAVVRALLGRFGRMVDLREALPGEFTRRAFENGRLDLTAVEGLSDLLAAETEAQRRQAMALADGRLRRSAEGWRAALVESLALVEASIDFGDDGVEGDIRVPALRRAADVLAELEAMMAGSVAAERIRTGFTVAICGRPNVGKSTLLNRLAGRDVALTSGVPGTTRDALEVWTDLDGLPVVWIDTAGLRGSSDPVETLGIARAAERIRSADLRIVLVDERGMPVSGIERIEPHDLVVIGKSDTAPSSAGSLSVSGLTGAGVEALLEAVRRTLSDWAASASFLGHERQRLAVQSAAHALGEAVALGAGEDAADLLAASLRAAIAELDRFVGRLDIEEVLDVVFKGFCVGK
jgi:tRNA modification GTPase